MTMVEYSEMGDKESQQRRRRADGAVRSVADRSAVEENRALAPQAAQTTQGRSSVDREPPCAGRDLVEHLAGVSERVERAPTIEVERIVSLREFRAREKIGCFLAKPTRGYFSR